MALAIALHGVCVIANQNIESGLRAARQKYMAVRAVLEYSEPWFMKVKSSSMKRRSTI